MIVVTISAADLHHGYWSNRKFAFIGRGVVYVIEG